MGGSQSQLVGPAANICVYMRLNLLYIRFDAFYKLFTRAPLVGVSNLDFLILQAFPQGSAGRRFKFGFFDFCLLDRQVGGWGGGSASQLVSDRLTYIKSHALMHFSSQNRLLGLTDNKSKFC